jgi:hypothetical protein
LKRGGHWTRLSFQEVAMRVFRTIAVLLLVAAAAAYAQKKGADPNRSVQGVVTTAEDQPVVGAVVQLKNLKTLQIRSFITQDGGTYYFHGLSPDNEFELKADHQGASSGSRTLSAFDSRKLAIINLKLNPKK